MYQRKVLFVIGSLVLLAGSVIGARWGYTVYTSRTRQVREQDISRETVLAAWQSKDYSLIVAETDKVLKKHPLDAFSLVFSGFASFYLGVQSTDGEQRIDYMQRSCTALRKGLIAGYPDYEAQIYYVLGKASYYRGREYYDDSIRFLNTALELNYRSADIWEYLTLAYRSLGALDRSADASIAALLENPDSMSLLMTAAMVHLEAGRTERAIEYADKVWKNSPDHFLREQAGILLLRQQIAGSAYDTALSMVSELKTLNPELAEAWYLEGLVYQKMNDLIRARAAWRRAISIDPMHAESRARLNERQ